uniref:8 kDa Amblyomma family member n=1 Tax=Rhipicephalus appendiculatus TaxID=34631 RepID=A0A131YFW1_RHIAP
MSTFRISQLVFFALAPLLLCWCSGTYIDDGAIHSCYQNCMFHENGSSSGCSPGCHCISNRYDALGVLHNPPGPGTCWISPRG